MTKKLSVPAEQIPEGDKASEASGAYAAPKIRSAYDGSRVAVRLICVDGEDRTQQSFRDECDINVLMKRYEKTGILPSFDREPVYLDTTEIDFQSSMDRVAEVQGVFSQLDARTRARFENNPELMLEFLADPANRAEAVKMGLVPAVSHSETGVDSGGQLADNVRTPKGGVSDADRGRVARSAESDEGATSPRNAADERAAAGAKARGEAARARGAEADS